MNTTRTAGDLDSSRWATSMEVQGLPNLYRVSDNLYRGARPTDEGLQELQKLGVRTVINLEKFNGDQAPLEKLGLTYEHIPMTALSLKDDDVAHFLRVAADAGHAPMFVHCRRGADRTGLMCAMYRIAIQGWTKDEAIAEMTRGGFRFNHGYQNIVNYIRDADVNEIKQRAGLVSAVGMSLN